MSAVVGILHYDGRPVEKWELAAMLDTMPDHGPDGRRVWADGAVGFGHGMLWTTPESLSETLPFANLDAGLTITADARIDNREELLAQLGPMAKPSREVTDSELILAAYERWGEDCADRLLGDFAFVIWDGRTRTLFCGRDPVGAKPLFYYNRPGKLFAFSTEIRGLLCLPEIPRIPNEAKIADVLVPDEGDLHNTIYEGVRSLPSANRMTVFPDGAIRISRYWKIENRGRLPYRTDEEYAEAYRERFIRTVRDRMRCAFPVGATLSGGMDSSSTACVARNILREKGGGLLPTFSAIWPSLATVDPLIDERTYIDAVLAQGGFQPHTMRVDTTSPLQAILDHPHVLDQAPVAPNLYMYLPLYKAVKDAGVRTLLTGNDGDTAVGYGLEYLAQLARTGRWLTLRRESEAWIRRRNSGLIDARGVMWKHGFKPNIPEGLLEGYRRVRGHKKPVPEWITCRTLNPDLVKRVGLAERLKSSGHETPMRTHRDAHVANFIGGHTQGMLQVINILGGIFGVDVRHPFFDRRFLEFCADVPSNQRFRDGWNRWILRRGMEGILPPEVQWRAWKGQLGSHFNRSLATTDRHIVEDVLFENAARIEPYVDLPKVRAFYGRFQKSGGLRSDDAFTVFLSVALGLWIRRLSELPAAARPQSREPALSAR